MIYIEKDSWGETIFKVDKVDEHYYGWHRNDIWEGGAFTLFPDSGDFMQRLLAPSILDRW